MTAIDPALLAYATDEDLAELERELELEQALKSPLDFAVYVSGAEKYPHLVYLNNLIMAMLDYRLYKSGIGPKAVSAGLRKWVHPETGEKCLTNIAISMPPRHGKSYFMSEHFPAWWAITHPELPFILTSYEADFAASWGEKARDHVEEHPEFDIFVNKDARSKAAWRLKNHRFAMYCAGTGGPITGKGAGIIGIDDPVKNSEEALSAVEREKADAWYQTTFRTRGNNKGKTGHFKWYMGTRWHEDDLGGRVLSREGDDWYIVNLPALAWDTTDEDGYSIDPETFERDPLGRRPGEALCPDLMTAEELLSIRAGGALWFAAMYQGKPNIVGGGLFIRENFLYYRKVGKTYELTDRDGTITYVPERDIVVRYAVADTATTDKTRSDYTVVTVFAITKDRRLLIDSVHRKKLESPDHEDFVRRICKQFLTRFLAVEDQTYGKALIQHLIRKGGIIVRKLKSDGDKISRAIPATIMMDNGQLYVPQGAEWLETFIDECCKFPNATHDDQVDTLSYGVRVWERYPRYKLKAQEDNSMEGKFARHRELLLRKKKAKRQVDMGD